MRRLPRKVGNGAGGQAGRAAARAGGKSAGGAIAQAAGPAGGVGPAGPGGKSAGGAIAQGRAGESRIGAPGSGNAQFIAALPAPARMGAAGGGGSGRACRGCGGTIGAGRRANARYCGDKCRMRTTAGRSRNGDRAPIGPDKCLYCNASIGERRRRFGSDYCGNWCNMRAKRPQKRHSGAGVPYSRAGMGERERRAREKEHHVSPSCRYCGMPMPPGRGASAIYCGAKCGSRRARERGIPASLADYRDADEDERRRRREPEQSMRRTCRYCGSALPADCSPKMRLCGNECRRRTAIDLRRHYDAAVRFEDASEAERERRRSGPEPRFCKRCGDRIPDRSRRKRYCGGECGQRAAYESYRSNPVAVEVNKARQREYARRRYATPEGKAAYLAASKRYQERLKGGGKGGPPLRRTISRRARGAAPS